jgi:hypothetical protein
VNTNAEWQQINKDPTHCSKVGISIVILEGYGKTKQNKKSEIIVENVCRYADVVHTGYAPGDAELSSDA